MSWTNYLSDDIYDQPHETLFTRLEMFLSKKSKESRKNWTWFFYELANCLFLECLRLPKQKPNQDRFRQKTCDNNFSSWKLRAKLIDMCKMKSLKLRWGWLHKCNSDDGDETFSFPTQQPIECFIRRCRSRSFSQFLFDTQRVQWVIVSQSKDSSDKLWSKIFFMDTNRRQVSSALF